MIQRFNDPAAMAKIRGEMIENLRRRGGAESILLTSVDRPWTGKRLSEMADTWKIEPIDAAVRILRANPRDSIASFRRRARPAVASYLLQGSGEDQFGRLVQHDR